MQTEEALERLRALIMDLSLIQGHSAAAKKVAEGLTEFETYIRNHREFIPNSGERYRQGEAISTACRGIDHPAGGQPAVGQETAEGVDPPWHSTVVTDANEGPQP